MTDFEICKKMVAINHSAKSRGIEFDLSFNVLKKVLNSKKCFFTGKPLNNIENDPNKLTIDRLDNDKGYVDGNIAACSKVFNEIKGCLTLKEIELLYTKLNAKGLYK